MAVWEIDCGNCLAREKNCSDVFMVCLFCTFCVCAHVCFVLFVYVRMYVSLWNFSELVLELKMLACASFCQWANGGHNILMSGWAAPYFSPGSARVIHSSIVQSSLQVRTPSELWIACASERDSRYYAQANSQEAEYYSTKTAPRSPNSLITIYFSLRIAISAPAIHSEM